MQVGQNRQNGSSGRTIMKGVGCSDDDNLNWLGDLLDPWKGRHNSLDSHSNESVMTRVGELPHPQRGADVNLGRVQQLKEEDCVEIHGRLVKLRNIINSHNPVVIQDEMIVYNPTIQTDFAFFQGLARQNEAALNSTINGEEGNGDRISGEEEMTFEQLFNPLSSLLFQKMAPVLDQTQRVSQTAIVGTQSLLHPIQQSHSELTEQQPKQIQPTQSNNSKLSPLYKINEFLPLRKKIKKKFRTLSRNRLLKTQNNSSSQEYELSRTIVIEQIQDIIIPTQKQANKEDRSHNNIQCVQSFLSGQSILSNPQRIIIQSSNDNQNNQEALRLPARSQKKIIKNNSQHRLTLYEQQITRQFQAVIRIINDKNLISDKIYKWELGTLRTWRSLAEALQINFYIYIRHSEKYKQKFMKYLPKSIIEKKEGVVKAERVEGCKNLKLERKREVVALNRRREMSDLKEIFNRVQVSKVIEYEKTVEERSEDDDMDNCLYSEYEPDGPALENMIKDIVVRTNDRISSKKGRRKAGVGEEVKAMHELVIHKLNVASQGFDYIGNTNQLFDLNRKMPSLSCLNGELGLRSNNLKVIDRATFEAEMERKKRMESAILIPNDNDHSDYPEQSLPLKYEVKKYGRGTPINE